MNQNPEDYQQEFQKFTVVKKLPTNLDIPNTISNDSDAFDLDGNEEFIDEFIKRKDFLNYSPFQEINQIDMQPLNLNPSHAQRIDNLIQNEDFLNVNFGDVIHDSNHYDINTLHNSFDSELINDDLTFNSKQKDS